MQTRILAMGALSFVLGMIGPVSLSQSADAPHQPGRGQYTGRGGWGTGGGMFGRGVAGTVTEIAPDHFKVKTETGEVYTVFYSVNTHIVKGGGPRRRRSDNEPPVTPPQPIKAADIKVGDAIASTGELDTAAKSVGAVAIFLIDPERARQMREMRDNYGKTWLMGKVSVIHEVTVTLQGGPDNSSHTFMADENTTFRKRREPITLADVQAGDVVRVEGSIKNGTFLATTVVVMGPPPERDNRPASPPQ
jgi:hypothetical protein